MSHKHLDPHLYRLSGRQLLLVTLYGEARGESLSGQAAVAHVIRNRLLDGRWGESYHDVLGAWAQFSCLWETLGGANYRSVVELADHLFYEEYPLGEEGQLVRQLEWVVDGVLEESLIDNTFGSTHYFATYIKPPYWAKAPGVRMATIGRHEFWIGVA